MTYATPLRIDLQPSRYAAAWLVLIHAAGLAILPFAMLPVWAMMLAAAAGLGSLWRHWSYHASRRNRFAINRFVWKTGTECIVVRRDGVELPCVLKKQAFVMPWLVILYVRRGRRVYSLFILPDMLDSESFRRLRVRLRTELDNSRQPAVWHGRKNY